MSRSGYKASASKNSYVDESLFGNSKAKPVVHSTGDTIEAKLKHSSAKTAKNNDPLSGVVMVAASDLQRMLKPSPIMSAEDIVEARAQAEAKRDAAQAVSRARKEKMLRMEEESKRNAQPTESAMMQTVKDGATMSRAQQLLEEEKDDVKKMNQMMLYSKCVTIRDAQIEEKRQMMAETEEENRKQDLMMEVERIKALEQYEVRERQRNEERRRGAAVLTEQIEERKRERMRAEELRDTERISMLKEIERMKEQELQAAIEKKVAAKELLQQVASANSEQIQRKELMKHREKDEDVKIAQYIRAKELREQELVYEKERVAAEKELECAKMRAQQERAADKQSELDELRARRYQEAKEREWRTKERAQLERHSAMQKELGEARAAQKNAKVQQQAGMATIEHDDFMRVLAVNRAKEHDEMSATAKTIAINAKYKEELLAQMQANTEARKKDRAEALEEGGRMRQAQEAELARLAQIKASKMTQLEGAGVPAKYTVELSKMKIKA
ncbi:hypothetical protein FOA52_003170 [Chlamydomonas sp. UWO 241]|nr:hypothetical protein FOA52_003170 [Chlamydomonas sp. UWO 241]